MSIVDAFPVAEGHTLVLPRKHVSSIHELSEIEQDAIWELVRHVRSQLLTGPAPEGFNIGLSDGRRLAKPWRTRTCKSCPTGRTMSPILAAAFDG